MKKLISAGILLGLLVFAACKKESKSNNDTISFGTTLSGANESTPNASTATGTVTGTFNTKTKVLSLTISYAGLTPTAGHIHKGAAGDPPGPVVFPFTDVSVSPFQFTSAPLDAAQEADLMADLYYVNLHTTTYPGGEIRGQLMEQ